MECRYARKLLRYIRVSSNDSPAVSENPDDSSVLPMTYLFLIGELQLSQEIIGHLALLSPLFEIRDKAWPRPFL